MDSRRKLLIKTLRLYFLVIVFIIGGLIGRLFYLQVVQVSKWELQSTGNRMRMISLPARRGDILDINGQVLATSQPVFAITATPGAFKNQQQELAVLVDILADSGLTVASIEQQLKKQVRRYEPVVVARLPWGPEAWRVVAQIEERRWDLPGIAVDDEPRRIYPNGALAGHLLGFVRQIDAGDLERFKRFNYAINDQFGKTGLEREFEVLDQSERIAGLRGKKGATQVEVNAANRKVREVMTIPPTPGDNVVLTLDRRLQGVMERSLDTVIADRQLLTPKAAVGAAVLLDVRTGAILAMASKPDLDPNDFVNGNFEQRLDYYNDEQLQPQVNRVVAGLYPPGSTFKMITAMAALESGTVTPQDSIIDTGAYWKPPYIKCWDVHGRVDLLRALAVSCNTYFQWSGERAGIGWIHQVGNQFGLGQKTNLLGVQGELRGILPNPDWKKEVNTVLINRQYQQKRTALQNSYNEKLTPVTSTEEREQLRQQHLQQERTLESEYRINFNFETSWQAFDTFNTSIGQGFNQYTIIQLANYTATLANGGTRMQPYVVDRLESPEGEVLLQFQPQIINQVEVSAQTIEQVRKGMRAVAEPGGTAYSLFRNFSAKITVAAKTGTAQTGKRGDDPQKDFHGLFVAFAPYENPQVAFAGIVEYGDSGSGSIGKVARDVLMAYFGIE